MRTLGLITYPLYLTHNVIGSAITRVLVDAGMDEYLAVWAGLAMLVLVCWFMCAKIEPAVRRQLSLGFSYVGWLPKERAAAPAFRSQLAGCAFRCLSRSRPPDLRSQLIARQAYRLRLGIRGLNSRVPDARQRETLLRRAGIQKATRHDDDQTCPNDAPRRVNPAERSDGCLW